MQWPDELSLGYTLVLNALVFAASFRRAGHVGNNTIAINAADHWQRVADALLLTFLVQYFAVGLPGLLHVLSLATMTLVAVFLSAAMWFTTPRKRRAIEEYSIPAAARFRRAGKTQEPNDVPYLPAPFFTSHWASVATAIFAAAFLFAVAWSQRSLAVTAEDSLTYHLPAALQWLADGRISLFPVWFFNPANTWSPLGGSIFMEWLLAPMHSDLLVRYVQIAPLVVVFVTMVQLCRSLRVSTCLALAVATATILSRPLISEAAEVKDDLFVCAFFLTAVAACDPQRLKDRWAPCRIGAGVGLMLSIKYTAVYELPLLLLLIDAPFRAGWRLRQWSIAVGCAALLAGPWYLRNLIATGNPVFPVEVSVLGHTLLHGFLRTQRSLQLRSFDGVWTVLTRTYHSIPAIVLALLAAGWAWVFILSMVRLPSQTFANPLRRLCLIGPVIAIALFVFTSPYPEIRFIFPALLLLFACFAMAAANFADRAPGAAAVIATLLVAVSVATSFPAAAIGQLLQVALPLAVVAFAAAFAYARFARRVPILARAIRWSPIAAVLILAMAIYIYWPGYVRSYREESVPILSRQFYGDEADGWQFVRENILSDVPIAYTNSHLVYPLLGLDYRRRVVYVPVRTDVTTLASLPHFPEPLAGEQVTPTVTRLLNTTPAATVWLERLRQSGAGLLFVASIPDGGTSPELAMAGARPDVFRLLFQQGKVCIFDIRFTGKR